MGGPSGPMLFARIAMT
ncbi:DUF6053 domain-containing protein [Lysobacter enzymogenes]